MFVMVNGFGETINLPITVYTYYTFNQPERQDESAATSGASWKIKPLRKPVERPAKMSFPSIKSPPCRSLLLPKWNKLFSSDTTVAIEASALNAWGAAVVVFKRTVASLAGYNISTMPTAASKAPGCDYFGHTCTWKILLLILLVAPKWCAGISTVKS